jgi:hypothetical protein
VALITRTRWKRALEVLVFLEVLGAGCSHVESAGGKSTTTPPVNKPLKMEVNLENPIIKMGDFLPNGLWNDPCVLKSDSGYLMYMTTSTKEPFKPPVLPFRAVSTDGVSWRLDPKTPLLEPGHTGYVSIETPSVVFFQGVYHMYYTGIFPAGTVPPMAIGHATSPDGVVWTPDPARNAVLSATGKASDWNGYLVGEPGALVKDGRIWLYFTAIGARPGGNPPQLQVIGLATTADGSDFGPPRKVLEQSALYDPAAGYVGYSTPSAVLYQGRVHLFFDVARYDARARSPWSQVALHHAVSDDGLSFQQDDNPLYSRESFDWTAGEINGPSVLFDRGVVRMWFAGHGELTSLVADLQARGRGRLFGIGFVKLDPSRFEAGTVTGTGPSKTRPARAEGEQK